MSNVMLDNVNALLSGLPGQWEMREPNLQLLKKLATTPGGMQALERLFNSDPAIGGPAAWAHFRDKCGGDPVVFVDSVNHYLNSKLFGPGI
jgi:hypothetical protein